MVFETTFLIAVKVLFFGVYLMELSSVNQHVIKDLNKHFFICKMALATQAWDDSYLAEHSHIPVSASENKLAWGHEDVRSTGIRWDQS